VGQHAFPSAEHVAERLLTIPVHPWIGARDRERLIRLLSSQPTPAAKPIAPHPHVTPSR